MLASLVPGDLKLAYTLAILEDLDRQERSGAASIDKSLELNEVREPVLAQSHHSGIDVILERTIPQPWRERFLQASIGSTRLFDGPYAADWDKFLIGWEAEMRHLQQHRTASRKRGID